MPLFNAVIITAIAIVVSYVAVCGMIYIIEEINSTVKNARRFVKDAMWELEWKWKMLKGDV